MPVFVVKFARASGTAVMLLQASIGLLDSAVQSLSGQAASNLQQILSLIGLGA